MGKGQQKKRQEAAAAAAQADDGATAPKAATLGDFMFPALPTSATSTPAASTNATLAPAPLVVQSAPPPAAAGVPDCGFKVQATKKGGLPIAIEPRNKVRPLLSPDSPVTNDPRW